MLFDDNLLFSNAQAITADAASTNSYKCNGDIGKGIPVPLHVQVMQNFNNLTSLTVKIQTATDAAFTSPVTLAETTVLLADLVAGKVLDLNYIPTGCLNYIRLYYDVTGTAPTTGKITAGVVTALDQASKA